MPTPAPGWDAWRPCRRAPWGFTTIELKTNFLATAREGALRCSARLVHGGGRTQVWDATVSREADERVIALFRCTQFLLPADDARTERQQQQRTGDDRTARTIGLEHAAALRAALRVPSAALRRKREATVREHMESENQHDFDATMSTFHHPRYEMIATGDVHDGEGEVARYFEETRAAFPDQRNELIALHHADDAVIVEFDLKGRTSARSAGCRRPAGRSRAAWRRCSCSRRTGWSASASTSTRRRSSASSASRTTR